MGEPVEAAREQRTPVAIRDGMAPATLRRGRDVLLDRDRECDAIDELLPEARAGRGSALLVRGEAGIGKTALLDYAAGRAGSARVIRASGMESEMELAYAGLHQLCAPLFAGLDWLPEPQRDALRTAFGLSSGGPADRYLIGLAALSLLAAAAEEEPLLCLVDDAQWMDRASVQVMAFVARRLLAESVVMFVATRERSDLFSGLPELVVEGLRGADALSLLVSVIPGRLDERVADELLAETRGNPLALLELPRGLTAAQLAGGFALPGALALSGRIEESFLRRLKTLPEDTRQLLLVAAAEPLGDPALLGRAAEILAITGAAPPAESAGLIEIDGRVRFRHPLVRSATYRSATVEERRRVHRALADATDAQIDPDRHAWHLAEASAGADEGVAAELERSAGRAQARGGLAAAAAFLERAAALTPEPSVRAERALAAAQTKFEAGALDDALALLATAETSAVDDGRRARVDLLRAQIAFASRRGSDAPSLLLSAARKLEPVNPGLARATFLEALYSLLFVTRLARGVGVLEVSEAALAGPPPPQPPRPPDLLLQGLAVRFTEGYAAGAPILKEALGAFRREKVLPAQEGRWLLPACWIAADLWDEDTWGLLTARELERVRQTGALTAMGLALGVISYVHAVSGELHAAESLLDEARTATEATGIASWPHARLWVAALRGRDAELSELIGSAASEAVARGEGFTLAITEHVSAVLYNGLGRYDAALAAVRHAGERVDEIGSPTWAVAELIEAAVRLEDHSLANCALERLTVTTQASGSDWALGIEARSRALLSDGDAAERLYREAIERLQRTRLRVDLARAHLVYGEWLRRERRRLDARGQLRVALQMFTSMGTEAFTGRAAQELQATGERVPKRSVETGDKLTAQEVQIARLAGEGLSNAEIGARLFISQHTVAYHLRKVFSKLDVTSRRQLTRVVPDSADTVMMA
jgi:DNA-binding CsgD family transcriptional regulator/tetratricopeptide (TPR) repeat protein